MFTVLPEVCLAKTVSINQKEVFPEKLNGGAMITYFNSDTAVIQENQIVSVENNDIPISNAIYYDSNGAQHINLAAVNGIDVGISSATQPQEQASNNIQTPEYATEQQRIAIEQEMERQRQEQLKREQENQLYEVNGRSFDVINGSEFDLLCRIVSAEAGPSENCAEAQEMVAEVVLNRMENPKYPDNLTDVIYSDGQFEPVQNGMLDTAIVTDSVKNSVYTALKEIHHPKNMLYFRAYTYHDRLTNYMEVCGTYFSLQ